MSNFEFPHAKLDQLWEDIRNDPEFEHMRQPGIRLVPGIGTNPYVMIVGEAPGATENEKGQPFVGKSGRVLRQLMKSANLNIQMNCWLTNVVKYRPLPRNRNPTLPEILAAKLYLRREWRYIYKPKILIPVGAIAFNTLAPGVTGGILANAGRILKRKTGYVIIPMIHPAYALRNENVRSVVERHWINLGEWLDRKGVLP